MSRSAKRIVGNISVLAVIVALVAALVVSAANPTLLNSDAKLTAEANAGTPIVQAASEPKTQPQPAVPDAAPVASDPGQAWSNEKMNQWLKNEGANSVRGFVRPFNLIQSWESKKTGEITLTVDNAVSIGDDVFHDNLGPANNLYIIAAVMMESIGDEAPDLKSVVAVTEDGKREESYTRKDEAHARAVESGEYVYP